LLFIPFFWRWGFFKRFPIVSRRFAMLPLVAFALVLALGLNQSDRTARWRLLLMSEREEREWSLQRFNEILPTSVERSLILPALDKRVELVKRVSSRLLKDGGVIGGSWVSCGGAFTMTKRERGPGGPAHEVEPSAVAEGMSVPFQPETSNPEKHLPPTEWRIFVVDLPRINAFVLPSTDVFVYTGLLEVTEDDEDMLAAVLSHEISHVVERHATEALGFLALTSVAFDILRGASWALTLSFPFLNDILGATFTFLDQTLAQKAYSRKLETEADALGMEMMAKAGFDPQGAVRLWEVLNELEQEHLDSGAGGLEGKIGILRTHPTGEQRLEVRIHLYFFVSQQNM
ncbi:hypothetical protein T439DRAFT_292519, partial [Meredithblackwellia eburnea MCA 4105]